MLPSNAPPRGGPWPPSRCSGYRPIPPLRSSSAACWLWCKQHQQQPPRHQADSQCPARPSWGRDLAVPARAAYSAGKVPPEPPGGCCCWDILLLTGNRACPFHGNTPRDNVGLRNSVVARSGPSLAVAGTWASESSPLLSDAPPPLGGSAPRDEGPPAAPCKGSTGDAASGEGSAGMSKFLLVRSRIPSTNPCTCESATRHWRRG